MAVAPHPSPQWDAPWSPQPSPRHRSRRAFIVAAIVVVVVLAAVAMEFTLTRRSKTVAGRTTKVTTPATSATTPPARTSTPTTAAGTSGDIPADQVNPPPLAGAYTPDPITVMRTLSPYIDWLFAHPNPALLANYMFPTCTQYNAVKAELTTLANNDWHARPSVGEIQWIKVNVPFTPAPGLLNGHPSYEGGGVKLVLTNTPQSADVLNAAGQVVTTFTDQQPLQMLGINFAQGPDGQFRVISEGAFNPQGGVAAFES
jgi:hypothetical protein